MLTFNQIKAITEVRHEQIFLGWIKRDKLGWYRFIGKADLELTRAELLEISDEIKRLERG